MSAKTRKCAYPLQGLSNIALIAAQEVAAHGEFARFPNIAVVTPVDGRNVVLLSVLVELAQPVRGVSQPEVRFEFVCVFSHLCLAGTYMGISGKKSKKCLTVRGYLGHSSYPPFAEIQWASSERIQEEVELFPRPNVGQLDTVRLDGKTDFCNDCQYVIAFVLEDCRSSYWLPVVARNDYKASEVLVAWATRPLARSRLCRKGMYCHD